MGSLPAPMAGSLRGSPGTQRLLQGQVTAKCCFLSLHRQIQNTWKVTANQWATVVLLHDLIVITVHFKELAPNSWGAIPMTPWLWARPCQAGLQSTTFKHCPQGLRESQGPFRLCQVSWRSWKITILGGATKCLGIFVVQRWQMAWANWAQEHLWEPGSPGWPESPIPGGKPHSWHPVQMWGAHPRWGHKLSL